MPFHDLGTTHDLIRRKSSLRVKILFHDALMTDGLSCQRRLVHIQRHRLQQFTISRYLVPRIHEDDIPHHDIAFGNLQPASATHHNHRFFIIHLIEDGKLTVSLHLKEESQTCGEENGNKDAYRFKKHCNIFLQDIILIERNTDR